MNEQDIKKKKQKTKMMVVTDLKIKRLRRKTILVQLKKIRFSSVVNIS